MFASVITALAATGLWAAVVLASVEWPLNQSQHETAVFRLGPVSADVRARQTLAAAEPFDVVVVPVKVGGPVDSAAVLRARVHIVGLGGVLVGESGPAQAVSTVRPFEMVRFRFPAPIPAGEAYYVEIDVPRETPWPVFLAATRGNRDPEGELFIEGVPTFADQDLAYQLLRRQSILERLPIWWDVYQGAVVVGIGLVALLHLVSFAAVTTLPARLRHRLPHPAVLGLAPPALLAAAYFALLFFVL